MIYAMKYLEVFTLSLHVSEQWVCCLLLIYALATNAWVMQQKNSCIYRTGKSANGN